MGVGVYNSNFGGRGGSFLVDGPPGGTEAEYRAYVDSCRADHGEAISQEAWDQEAYDDFNTGLLESLESAARAVGLQVEKRKGFGTPSAPFDRDISMTAQGDHVAFGWRSWETDFVVAAGPTGRADTKLDLDAGEAADEIGRDPEAYKADYDTLASDVLEFVRLSLLKDGYGCRFRTSGYTSLAYEKPADIKARMEALKNDIKAMDAKLGLDQKPAMASLASEERVKLARTLIDKGGLIAIPAYDHVEKSVYFYAPPEPGSDQYWPVAVMIVPDLLADYVAGLAPEVPDGGRSAIPRNAETEAWYVSRQQQPREKALIVTAEEVALATGRDVEIEIAQDDKMDTRLVALATLPQPSPRM